MFETIPLSLVSIAAVTTFSLHLLAHFLHLHKLSVIVRISNGIDDQSLKRELQVALVQTLIRRIEREPLRFEFSLLRDLFRRTPRKR